MTAAYHVICQSLARSVIVISKRTETVCPPPLTVLNRDLLLLRMVVEGQNVAV